jgi:tripartite-type tricarboxylate transporter receptor subunit TctC
MQPIPRPIPRFLRVALPAVLALGTVGAQAQSSDAWPAKPIRIVVAYAPGGTGDVLARVVAERLRGPLGQTVLVENRPGASGMIGTQAVTRAAPDGYTFLMGQTGEMVINKFIVKNIAYDAEKELVPVVLVGRVPLALAVPASLPAKNLAELVAAAKDGKTVFASSGAGTPGHLAAETLVLQTGTPMIHAPYKGAGAAMADLIGAHVSFFFSGMPAAMPHVKAGKLRILALSTARRFPTLPDVPTVAEAAKLPGFDFSLWGGLYAPTGTPGDIVKRLNAEVNKVLATPAVRDQLVNEGTEIIANTPEEFAAFMKTESAKYAEVLKRVKVSTD